MRARFLIVLLLGLVGSMRSGLADDHGNEPGTATPLATGSPGLTATLEIDTDEDWFVFTAAPSLVYTIAVDRITLWDTDIGVKMFATDDPVVITNSAFSAQGSRVVWTNQGGLRPVYIGVGGLFQFTTGTYSVVVSGQDSDTDGDGMADAWEMGQFGTLTNGASGDVDGDGFLNGDEYVAGTGAANPASNLSVLSAVPGSSGTLVSWPVTPFGSYRIEATTNLGPATVWLPVIETNAGAAAGVAGWLDPGGTNRTRHYRALYRY
jgi:hypothetical protein